MVEIPKLIAAWQNDYPKKELGGGYFNINWADLMQNYFLILKKKVLKIGLCFSKITP